MRELRCFRYGKDTNLKAIHNEAFDALHKSDVVSDMAKILIWKLFTTRDSEYLQTTGCFRYGKDTNLKAIHNDRQEIDKIKEVVSDMAKILIWKLFTTMLDRFDYPWRCFRYGKDTNLKAIHNVPLSGDDAPVVVSDMAKILIWKLFTTIKNAPRSSR